MLIPYFSISRWPIFYSEKLVQMSVVARESVKNAKVAVSNIFDLS